MLSKLGLHAVESTCTESNPLPLSVWVGLWNMYLIYINIEWYKLCCCWCDYTEKKTRESEPGGRLHLLGPAKESLLITGFTSCVS